MSRISRRISLRCSGVGFVLIVLVVLSVVRQELLEPSVDLHQKTDDVVDSLPVERRLVHTTMVPGKARRDKMAVSVTQ